MPGLDMFFYRATRTKNEPPSERRLAHARKAVQRDKDSVPLFPEMVKHHTPQDRIAALDQDRAQARAAARAHLAQKWREARTSLRARQDAHEIKKFWNLKVYPGDPIYLLSLLNRIERNQFSISAYRADLDRIREVGKAWREKPRS